MKKILFILALCLSLTACQATNSARKKETSENTIVSSMNESAPSLQQASLPSIERSVSSEDECITKVKNDNRDYRLIEEYDIWERNRDNWDHGYQELSIEQFVSSEDLRKIKNETSISLRCVENNIIYTDLEYNVAVRFPAIKLGVTFEKQQSKPKFKCDYRKLTVIYTNPTTKESCPIEFYSYYLNGMDGIRDFLGSQYSATVNMIEDLQSSKGQDGRRLLEAEADDKYIFIYEQDGGERNQIKCEMSKESYKNGGRDLLMYLANNFISY